MLTQHLGKPGPLASAPQLGSGCPPGSDSHWVPCWVSLFWAQISEALAYLRRCKLDYTPFPETTLVLPHPIGRNTWFLEAGNGEDGWPYLTNCCWGNRMTERPTPPPGTPRELPQVFGDRIKSGPRGAKATRKERETNGSALEQPELSLVPPPRL